ncbi:hypothetical protein N4G41_25180 [Kosakonia sacchari]|uniref:hypothetical protein n=1 Tax=Kosakonia sacchari TaxID=1158459 RepID=UPI002ACEE9BB|nr:hypothetical protein [Kosakonia sacchari]MDZ7324929.1 hypothetical protein [Kosakonia sacchari]
MTLYEVIDLLEKEYGHTELWFYSGTGETEPDVIVNNIANWKWPKILKRNGRAVAEFTGNGKDWELMGDYKTPHNDPCSPPWGACPIDDGFISLCTYFNY